MIAKQHIIWTYGTTLCGRQARPGDIHDPRLAHEGELCKSCVRSYVAAFPASSIYNTAGAPR